MLHRAGLRFRKDRYIRFERRGVKVDVVFPTERVAVFIDGCFWHRCPEHATMPTRNYEYWLAKFRRNMDRDVSNNENLRRLGWRVLRVWEHEVKNPELAEAAVERVVDIVRGRHQERIRFRICNRSKSEIARKLPNEYPCLTT